jgi:glycosyltransferase involved in cell wall biosynthesis
MITTLASHRGDGNADEGAALPHVLLVLDQLPRTLGGGERIALQLAELLPTYGFRASILTFWAHPESAAMVDPPCPIYLLPLQRTYDLAALKAAIEFRRFLKTQKVEIVQTFFESSDIWAGFVTRVASSAKLIWSRRDMGILRGRKHDICYRFMAGFPHAVFAVSEQVRRHCIEVDGIEPLRVETIYNGIDLNAWSEAIPHPNENVGPLVTTVGNIRRVKGHDVLVKAAAIVLRRFPNAKFSIAGDVLEQDYFAELQTLVEELGIQGSFKFAGGVSDIRGHLSAAEIFVLPSRSEGFSNAIVQAMAASLPVVATDVGGNAEAVRDGVTGYVVPPENPEALAEAIMKLLSDPVCAAKMGNAGQTYAKENFTIETMMDRTTAAYRRLLHDR